MFAGSAAESPAMDKIPAAASELIVADFNSGRKPNNIGGDFGAWIKDPNDPMQGCIVAFDGTNGYGGKGNALRLIYSVDSDKPAFGGLWMRLQNLNAGKFDNLALRVRGDAGMGFTTVVKVELKEAMDQASHVYVRGVSDQWQDVVLPLSQFQGMANPALLKEFVIVFEDRTATAKRGMIYLDDIRFSAGKR
jgi:hypothetical protein